MTEPGSEPVTSPAVSAMRRHGRQSRTPLIIGIIILAALVVGAVYSMLKNEKLDEPWRIDYPGVTVVPGGDDYTSYGKRMLRLIVRFDKDVVSAEDGRNYLAALVRATDSIYDYYLVKVLNRTNVHVLDMVADSDERHSIFATESYTAQAGKGLVRPAEDETSPDVDMGVIIDEPDNTAARPAWEFEWPGLRWLSGDEGKVGDRRALRVTVMFHADEVRKEEIAAVLRELAERQKGEYPAFRIHALNRRGTPIYEGTLDAGPDGSVIVIPLD